jgi:hypothetical protein
LVKLKTGNHLRKINERKSQFFENINKFNKPLSRVIKRKREKTQTTMIRNKRGDITTDSMDTERIIKNIMNSFMPTNLTTQINGPFPWVTQYTKTQHKKN